MFSNIHVNIHTRSLTYMFSYYYFFKYTYSRVQAEDPDIGDPSVPQNITYFLDQTAQIAPHFQISSDGALR